MCLISIKSYTNQIENIRNLVFQKSISVEFAATYFDEKTFIRFSFQERKKMKILKLFDLSFLNAVGTARQGANKSETTLYFEEVIQVIQ